MSRGSGAGALCVVGLLAGACGEVSDGTEGTTGDTSLSAEGAWASGISVDAIEVNQGVGVLVLEGGTAIGAARRTAPLIAGREAVVRVLWSLEEGFEPRRIEATLRVAYGVTEDVLTETLRIRGPADRDLLDGTVNFPLPAEAVAPDTTVTVELREIEEGIGTSTRNASPGVALEAEADPRELEVVVFACATSCGDPAGTLSAAQRSILDHHLYNVFPVQALDLGFATAPLETTACDQAGILDEMTARRTADGAGPQVYYHCVFPNAYESALSGGFAWVVSDAEAEPRVSFSVNWWGPKDEMVTNVAHELGHSHGRQHPWEDPEYAPAEAAATGCNTGWGLGLRPGPHPTSYWNPAMADPSAVIMPPSPDLANCSPEDAKSPPAGVFPPQVGDFMGYNRMSWVDTYTWNALAERIRAVTALGSAPSAPPARRTLHATLTPGGGVRWTWTVGGLEALAPEGGGEQVATVRTADGAVHRVGLQPRVGSDGEVYGFSLPLPEAAAAGAPAAVPGWSGDVVATFGGRTLALDLADLDLR